MEIQLQIHFPLKNSLASRLCGPVSTEIGLSLIDLESRLARIVAKLTRMAMKFDGVSESSSEYNSSVDHEHEHRPPRN